MCGISALFQKNGEINLDHLRAMNQLIHHRGPDDEGIQSFREGVQTIAALGHTRLSIIDLSEGGHQPMGIDQHWLVYNGEIYNYIELREELEGLGVVFKSKSDSEVVLRSYLHWGKGCLDRFNGMFAFVIYDVQNKAIFAARDRFAVKPLYYWISPEGCLAFASEIKQFTVLPRWNPRINGPRVFDFLNWSITNHSAETCYDSVFQLRGGELMEAKIDELPVFHVRTWYRLPTAPFQGSFEQATEKFTSLLEDSVRLRLRADVPVGSCLSGGLDSSSIVCLMNGILRDSNVHDQQNTFSACTTHQPFDESPYMRQVVDQTGVKAHHTFPEIGQLFEELDSIIWHQDEPFGSTSIFAQWEVFKLAREKGVKVMLDGQGADEQLAGYQGFLGTNLHNLLQEGSLRGLLREAKAMRTKHGIKHPLVQLARSLAPSWIRPLARRLFRLPVSWINRDLLGVDKTDPHSQDWPRLPPLNRLAYAQLTSTNLPMLLHYEDRDSMAHSIESRTPFVDYRLIEFVQSLPAEFKIQDGMTKQVLREGMKGVLPEEIRLRVDKLGFATPEEVWIKQHPEQFKREVREAVEASQGILTQEAVHFADRVIDGTQAFDFTVWRMIILGRWMKRFEVSC